MAAVLLIIIRGDKKFWFNLVLKRRKKYLFANGVEIIKFTVKDSKVKAIPLCLGSF